MEKQDYLIEVNNKSKEKLNNEILTPIDSNDKYFIYKFK